MKDTVWADAIRLILFPKYFYFYQYRAVSTYINKFGHFQLWNKTYSMNSVGLIPLCIVPELYRCNLRKLILCSVNWKFSHLHQIVTCSSSRMNIIIGLVSCWIREYRYLFRVDYWSHCSLRGHLDLFVIFDKLLSHDRLEKVEQVEMTSQATMTLIIDSEKVSIFSNHL